MFWWRLFDSITHTLGNVSETLCDVRNQGRIDQDKQLLASSGVSKHHMLEDLPRYVGEVHDEDRDWLGRLDLLDAVRKLKEMVEEDRMVLLRVEETRRQATDDHLDLSHLGKRESSLLLKSHFM